MDAVFTHTKVSPGQWAFACASVENSSAAIDLAAPRVGAGCAGGAAALGADASFIAGAAPPLRRSGSVAPDLLARLAQGFRIEPATIKAWQWIDNGPGWVAVMLRNRAEILALRPDFPVFAGQPVGVVAPWDLEEDGTDANFEVRGFITARSAEDPVTGSLNAGSDSG